MIKHALLIAVGLAALVLNPFFGCDGKEDFRYGANEMRAAIEGTWKLTLPAVGGAPAQELVLAISQAATPTQHSRRPGLVTDAAACGQRSLIRSAGACVDESEMPLDVTLLAGGDSAKGTLRVFGTRFTEGHLRLDLGEQRIRGVVAPTGTVRDVRADGGPTELPGASMVRLATAQR